VERAAKKHGRPGGRPTQAQRASRAPPLRPFPIHPRPPFPPALLRACRARYLSTKGEQDVLRLVGWSGFSLCPPWFSACSCLFFFFSKRGSSPKERFRPPAYSDLLLAREGPAHPSRGCSVREETSQRANSRDLRAARPAGPGQDRETKPSSRWPRLTALAAAGCGVDRREND
jgi:hypothetical protein